MHFTEEAALVGAVLGLVRDATPGITVLAESVEAGKPVPFAEIWEVIEPIGDEAAKGKFGKMTILHGRKHPVA